jgi:hypothetical protein
VARVPSPANVYGATVLALQFGYVGLATSSVVVDRKCSNDQLIFNHDHRQART